MILDQSEKNYTFYSHTNRNLFRFTIFKIDQSIKMSIDILAFGAHPDDTELSCSGTLAALVKQNKRVAIVDLTRGEMGTRGTPELRLKEAKHAAEILGIHARDNLGLPDT